KARPKRLVHSPGFDVRAALYYVVGLDLTEIEGISELTALTIISEIGPEVSKFATVKKFCSWLGLCPNWKKTGGRVKSSRTRPGVSRAATAFRLAARGLHRSQGAVGAFRRRAAQRRRRRRRANRSSDRGQTGQSLGERMRTDDNQDQSYHRCAVLPV